MMFCGVDSETGQRYPVECALCRDEYQPELHEEVHEEHEAPVCPSCFTMLSKLRSAWSNSADEELRDFLDRVEQRLKDTASARKRPREHWEEHHRLLDQARVRWEME